MKNDSTITIQELKKAVGSFVKEREWEQFHSPKNLSMAMAIEAAELMEAFRFISCQESKEVVKTEKEKIAFELADVTIAALSFCNLYDIDLGTAVLAKLAHNTQKYPVELAKGSPKKYTHHLQT